MIVHNFLLKLSEVMMPCFEG